MSRLLDLEHENAALHKEIEQLNEELRRFREAWDFAFPADPPLWTIRGAGVMVEPLVLVDEFCGAGGATRGYQEAGFYVIGVDINPQPHYCGDEFIQMDALEHLATADFSGVDAIHASPPCQAYTSASNRWRGQGTAADDHPDLIAETRRLLEQTGLPWVMENVVGAAKIMRPTLCLDGSMFDLGVHRPRLFESNVLILVPTAGTRGEQRIGVYGRSPDGRCLNYATGQRAASSLEEAQEAMGMDWADWRGTKEAIPPAYTEYIGAQLMQYVKSEKAESGGRGNG